MLGTANSANPAVTTTGPKVRGSLAPYWSQLGDIDVIAPGFADDCLETLEEIAICYASLYRSHGGGELRYIPALNDSPGHIKALASLLRRHLRGWAPGPRIS